jgi:phage tail sheath gpL-like
VNGRRGTSTVHLHGGEQGPTGNDIDLRVNYLGVAGQEVTPTGLTFTITAMASGATAPA